MKICVVHNAYEKYSGEESVLYSQKKLLEANGHTVCLYERSSAEIQNMAFGKLRAFFSGLYNSFSRRSFKRFLRRENPDVIHIHHLYPLISPSILPIAKALRLPVVMTVHNYRLICPAGTYYSKGEVCQRCFGGREYWCVIKNCEGSFSKSFGYALRNWWARRWRYYLDNVDVFMSLTNFQHDCLKNAGIGSNSIVNVPNMVDTFENKPGVSEGEYIGYAGRLSKEKGINILVDVAKINTEIPFVAAGSYEAMPELEYKIPANFTLLGYCANERLHKFYEDARIIVFPSVWFEGFPIVLLEAMLHEKAVICSDIGGLSDIVDNGVTGLLSEPGSKVDLNDKIQYLWQNPELCQKMGRAGRDKVLREYSKEQHYKRLIQVYKKAIIS